jgi:hypothetical protein
MPKIPNFDSSPMREKQVYKKDCESRYVECCIEADLITSLFGNSMLGRVALRLDVLHTVAKKVRRRVYKDILKARRGKTR